MLNFSFFMYLSYKINPKIKNKYWCDSPSTLFHESTTNEKAQIVICINQMFKYIFLRYAVDNT